MGKTVNLKIGDHVYYLDLLGKAQIRRGVITEKTKTKDSKRPFLYKINIDSEPVPPGWDELSPNTNYAWKTKVKAIKGAVDVIENDLATKVKNLRLFASDDILRIRSYLGE